MLLCSCSSDDAPATTRQPDPSGEQGTDAGARDAASTAPDAGLDAGSLDASSPDAGEDLLTEKTLSLTLSLTVSSSDAGAADAAVASDAGDAGVNSEVAKLTIVAADQGSPVITDLWLWSLDGAGTPTPITGFTSTGTRKSPRLMLPATINGQPSGLAPANDGHANGVLTDTSRGALVDGGFVPSFDGTVVVTLASAPTAPILVVAAVEDQRYAGAAVINPDGTSGSVPANQGTPETHVRRDFTRDVKPILHDQCIACHIPNGPENAGFYLVTGTVDELIHDNFEIAEGTNKCKTANPDAGVDVDACIAAITGAQFLVEPGVPAMSDILQRARPDEDAGMGAEGLLWFGSKGARYNATYGDRRMPSTTFSTNTADWQNAPTPFDMQPAQFQVLFDWVAQGAKP